MRFTIAWKRIIVFTLLFTLFLMNVPVASTVYAASLKYYNYTTNSNETYTGKQVTYTYNNQKLSLTYPGLIFSGIALADCEDLFEKSLGLQAEVSGNVISITNGKIKLELTVGSKTVLVNGKSETTSIAPMKIKINNDIKYYVPTRYVAETFGFEYVWYSSSNSVKITKPLTFEESGTTFTYTDKEYTVKHNGQKISSDMPVIYYKGSVIVPAKQIFQGAGCLTKEENNAILITKNELTIRFEADSRTVYVNEKKIINDSSSMKITDCITGKSEIYVPLKFAADLLGYELTYSNYSYNLQDTAFTGSIDLYPDLKNGVWKEQNYGNIQNIEEQGPQTVYYEWYGEEKNISGKKNLSKVKAYATENAAVVEFYGITRDDINDFLDNGIVVFELKDVTTDIGPSFYADFDIPHLLYTLLTPLNTNIKVLFMIPIEDEWTFVEQRDCVQVYFHHADLAKNDLQISSNHVYPDDKLVIPLPDGISLSNISDEDAYLSKKIHIKIDGNHVEYFNKHALINPYYFVGISSISYDAKTNKTTISLSTNSICGYTYTLENGYLAINIGKPTEIYSKIIVLDAGHGGIDPGAVKNGVNEKDINYKIINVFAKEFFKSSDIKVYFTRETDVKIDLYDRAAFASEVGADMFISVHMNSSNLSSVSGTQVYYSGKNNKVSDTGFSSYQLAKALVNNLSTAMGTRNRGVTKEDFVVVKHNTVPAVLIEMGFITNTAELSKLTNATYQKKAAETIFKTVTSLYSTYFLR